MSGEPASEHSLPVVRLPDAEDIARLQAIEASADELVPYSRDEGWPPAAAGAARMAGGVSMGRIPDAHAVSCPANRTR